MFLKIFKFQVSKLHLIFENINSFFIATFTQNTVFHVSEFSPKTYNAQLEAPCKFRNKNFCAKCNWTFLY